MLGLILIIASCKKNYTVANTYPDTSRKIRFRLSTNKDFSGNTSIINFSLFIRKGSITLFDTALAPMQIKDIPDAAHQLVFEKTVTVNNNEDLAAGFFYELENVGSARFIDTSKAGNTFKIIDYSFQ